MNVCLSYFADKMIRKAQGPDGDGESECCEDVLPCKMQHKLEERQFTSYAYYSSKNNYALSARINRMRFGSAMVIVVHFNKSTGRGSYFYTKI